MSNEPRPATPSMGSRDATVRVLRQRRWVALSLLIVILVPTFLLLARWQWHRNEWRHNLNQRIEAGLNAAPIPLLDLTHPGATFLPSHKYKHVAVVGTYDAPAQRLVRDRPLNSANGFYVVTPLDLTTGGFVLVERGWVAASGNARSTPTVSPPPSGVVKVTGWLNTADKNPGPRPADLPAGQIAAAYPPDFGGADQTIDGVVVLMTSTPEQGGDLTLLPSPDLGAGPHLSYMIQWICFAILAGVGWWVLFRRDVREQSTSDVSVEQTPDL